MKCSTTVLSEVSKKVQHHSVTILTQWRTAGSRGESGIKTVVLADSRAVYGSGRADSQGAGAAYILELLTQYRHQRFVQRLLGHTGFIQGT